MVGGKEGDGKKSLECEADEDGESGCASRRDQEERGKETREKREREGRRCRDYHIMVPGGRISCATT